MLLGVLAAAVQLGYLFAFFGKIGGLIKRTQRAAALPDVATTPVSIIICAKNEAPNLLKNLPYILQQSYNDASGRKLYEVLVVDDGSTDDTALLLEDVLPVYPQLRVITIGQDTARDFPGKKFALGMGVKHALYEHLLLTDADCVPASNHWLQHMAAPFAEGKTIVAGYAPIKEEQGLLNRLIRLETLHTALQYCGYLLGGVPYMAVGRNLACTKAMYEAAEAHPDWAKVPSGDDDLLVNFCGTKENMTVVLHPDTFMESEGKATWRAWIGQKQRHVSSGKYYSGKAKAVAGVYGLTHGMLWGCALLLPVLWHAALPVMLAFIIALVLKLVLYPLVLGPIGRYLSVSIAAVLYPVYDLCWLGYNLFFAPFIFWKNKQQWK